MERELAHSVTESFAMHLEKSLRTARFGHHCRYTPTTGSTNRDMAEHIARGAPEGFLLVAGEQREGRGRMGRLWHSPPAANLYCSLLLRPRIEPARAASLPLVTGLAVAQAVRALAPEVVAQVKWPNDILSRGRKLCGILCDMQMEGERVGAIVAGIGLNVNLARTALPKNLRNTATSLLMESGRNFALSRVMATILNFFEPLYDEWLSTGLAPLLPQLMEWDALRGRHITVRQGSTTLQGSADGILPDGALRLLTPSGAVPLYSGEATLKAEERKEEKRC